MSRYNVDIGSMASTPLALFIAAAASTSTATPSLSWDVLGGGTDGGSVVRAHFGFSNVVALALDVPLVPRWTLGVTTRLDVGHWTPRGASDDVEIVFEATGRLALVHDGAWSVGTRFGVGGGAQLNVGGGSLRIPLAVSALYAIDPRVLVGARLDVPIRAAFPSNQPDFFTVPVILSLVGEVHLLPSLAVTAEAGLGPALDTRGIETALRAQVGAAYRL